MNETLGEFITHKVRPMYQGLEAGTGAQLTHSHVLEAMAEITAYQILGAVKTRVRQKEPTIINTAGELIEWLERYINGGSNEQNP